ncbi:MAG: CorA family divalent cation transporter, partial [bacterium]|nr:CorA family divalent cation transporter [bacterium]
MKTVYKHKSAVWVDLVEPTTEEIEELSREYALDPLVSYELITPSLKYRIEPKRDQLFLIMHLPAFKETNTPNSEVGFKDSKEIDIVVGKNFLITVRYEEIDAVERFAKKVEVESILGKETPVHSRELLFFGLFKELSQGLFNQLAYIDGWLKEIEADMFKGREKEMVSSL